MAGICQYLFEEFDLTEARIFSTSASTFPVVCAMVGVSPSVWFSEDYPKCLNYWYARPLSAFLDSTSFLRQLWCGFLRKDAYKLLENRLTMSVTRLEFSALGLPHLVNERVSLFQSNEDLVDTLLATINIPGIFFRGFPKWRGYLSFDGAYTETPIEPGGKTIVINLSPVSGPASDISPSRKLPWLGLLLPSSMEQTKQMWRGGYEDARANRGLFESRGWRPKTAGPGLDKVHE